MIRVNYEPINLKNRHIFKQSTKNDEDEYYRRSLRLNVISWNEIPKKVQKLNFSIPESILNQKINSLFHVKKIFLNTESALYFTGKLFSPFFPLYFFFII